MSVAHEPTIDSKPFTLIYCDRVPSKVLMPISKLRKLLSQTNSIGTPLPSIDLVIDDSYGYGIIPPIITPINSTFATDKITNLRESD